ncbi:SRPBCC family protein [Fulvivirgaceae bacterium BMA10]|uniref:SRPBCC family protein n=1 Tax=Splendidivirga corallicola TaxID=3051826 RepID=A0ABT8KSI5_9BACT|nr:SRPBCC family protein [Fulvivirgaceae bacterium BMA10]
MKYQCTIIINKPRDIVWKLLSNPDDIGKWSKGFKKLEIVSGFPGEEGSQVKHIYEEKGREIEFLIDVVKVVENRCLHYVSFHETMSINVKNVLEKADHHSTSLISHVDVTFHKLFFRIMSPLMKRAFLKRHKEDFGRMKKLLEES